MTTYIIAILVMASIALCAQETTDENIEKRSSGKPDGHALIAVMGDLIHNKGEWMFSYRYMYMNMENLKRGSDDASFEHALEAYMVTPTQMLMNMHVGTMYAPSDRTTLMALKNSRFDVEFGHPLYQDLNGIPLKNKETVTLGLQHAL